MSKEIIYWTMKNGKKISVDDMDINHLRNTLKMIIRNVNKKTSKKRITVQINGEIAQAMIDDAIDQMMFDELDNPDLLY
jgi:hypothetical protein